MDEILAAVGRHLTEQVDPDDYEGLFIYGLGELNNQEHFVFKVKRGPYASGRLDGATRFVAVCKKTGKLLGEGSQVLYCKTGADGKVVEGKYIAGGY